MTTWPFAARVALRLCPASARIALQRFLWDLLHRGRSSHVRSFAYGPYVVFYPSGDSIVERLKLAGGHEQLSFALAMELVRTRGAATVLDIGAHIGLFALEALSANPDVVVYCFEPSPIPLKCLLMTQHENQLSSRLKIVPAAASDQLGLAGFATHGPDSSSGDGLFDTGRAGASQTAPVAAVTVDSLVADAGIPAVSLMKIDVEGAEERVLRGSRTVLSEHRPFVLLEAHTTNLAANRSAAADLWGVCAEHRYRVVGVSGTDWLDAAAFEASVARGDEENYFAVPEERTAVFTQATGIDARPA